MGPGGGADAGSLQHWLLQIGEVSAYLWMIVASFAEWAENHRLPWAAYRALIAGRIIFPDRNPGV